MMNSGSSLYTVLIRNCPCEQQELSKKKAQIQERIQERERIIQTLPEVFQAKKVRLTPIFIGQGFN